MKRLVLTLLLLTAFSQLPLLCSCAPINPAMAPKPSTPVYSTLEGTALINYMNELSEVTIKTEEDGYSVGVEEIKVTWINESPYDAIWGVL